MKKDVAFFDNLIPKSFPDTMKEGSDVIVIHPGARNLRLGFANKAYPIEVPNVIALKNYPKKDNLESQKVAKSDTQSALSQKYTEYSKKKLISYANSQVKSYNKSVRPQNISEINDAFLLEYIDSGESSFFTGSDVNVIPENENFSVFFPFSYKENLSLRERSEMFELIVMNEILKEYKLSKKSLGDFCVVLVVDNSIDKEFLYQLVNLLLMSIEFKAVSVLQEGVAASFGAGFPSSSVLDIGEESVKVCCIEDGYLIPESRLSMPFGGYDLTKLLFEILIKNEFPYKECDFPRDFNLLDEIKQMIGNYPEELNTEIVDFYVRKPGRSSKLYQLKYYDEQADLILALFEPEIAGFGLEKRNFEIRSTDSNDPMEEFSKNNESKESTDSQGNIKGTCDWNGCKFSVEKTSDFRAHLNEKHINGEMICRIGSCNSQANSAELLETHCLDHFTKEKAGEEVQADLHINAPLMGIDRLLVKSIEISSLDNQERGERLSSNILLVGGSNKFPGLQLLLEARLKQNLSEQVYKKVETFLAPREIDPRFLSWKGAAILCRLESSRECWINRREWSELGIRKLKDKLNFMI